jgi:OFA family oxalate/formate antiporter-like MFS transporter
MHLGGPLSVADLPESYKDALAGVIGTFQAIFWPTRCIGRGLTLMISNVIIALGILGGIVSAIGIPILLASIALLGIFYGITWPMYGACGGDYFRKEVMGTVIGAWTPFYGLGAILAHFITGRIRDMTQSFQMAFYLAVLFALVAAFLMQRVKRPDEGNR